MKILEIKMIVIIIFILTPLFNGCKPSDNVEGTGVIAKVNGLQLTRSEVENVIPKTANSSDSLLIAESYIKKWAKDALIYEVAQRNLGEDEETINRLVDEYKRSLLRHRYQEKMVQSRLSVEISENELRDFYQENISRFVLDKNIIKGLFLKVPIDAPDLNQVRKWYKSNDSQSIENIEKYGIKNAALYDYFYDRWVDFNEILDKMPLQPNNQAQYLNNNQSVEITDSTYCYFLNISEYLLVGKTAPYEYAEPQIKEMLINKRKVSFLKDFEEELYRAAVRKGKVEFYTNQN